jgi:hypothetical protein
MRRVLMASGSGGGNGVPVRNGLVAEYKFDECRNLLKYSQWFDNAAWTKSNATITANDATAPDGSQTADKITITANKNGYFEQSIPLPNPNGKDAVFSIYLKAGTQTTVEVYLADGDDSVVFADCEVDLSTGLLVTSGYNSEYANWTVNDAGNQWWRLSGHLNLGVGYTSFYLQVGATVTNSTYFYSWGAQFEISPVSGQKNLIVQTERFDCWIPPGMIRSETNNVVSFYELAPSGYHSIGWIVVVPASTFTFSVYIKKLGRRWVFLSTYLVGFKRTWFDLDNGVVGTKGHATADITDAGDGWYRISVVDTTASATPTSLNVNATTGDNISDQYGGDVAQGFTIKSAQCEVGSLTSYEARIRLTGGIYVPTLDKQWLMDYSKPRKNLLLPNIANGCSDATADFAVVNAAGTTLTASTEQAWQGSYSLKCVCSGSVNFQGWYTGTNWKMPVKPNTIYTLSMYIKSTAEKTVKIDIFEKTEAYGVATQTTSSILTCTGGWDRLSVTVTTGATTAFIAVGGRVGSQQAATYYFDGMQLEEGSSATTWEAPPNMATVGNAWVADGNDPTWVGEGAYFVTDDFCLSQKSVLLGQKYTIIAVIIPPNPVTTGSVISKNSSSAFPGSGFFCLAYATTNNLYLCQFRGSDGDSTGIMINGGCTPGIPMFFAFTCDGDYTYGGVNTSTMTRGDALAGGVAENTTNPLAIGRYAYTSSAYYNGKMCYILLYNRVLSQSELTKVRSYLRTYLLKNRGVVLP